MASASNKRTSILPPAGPKPPLHLPLNPSTLTLGDHITLIGTHPITISANTAIHPRAKLNATHASISIGSNCVISERCTIGVSAPQGEEEPDGVIIEDGVVVELDAVVESKTVGTGTVVEVRARLGRGSVIGKHCKIGPLSEVRDGEVVPDYTVIFGDVERRIDRSSVEHLKTRTIGKQIQVLKRIIPTNLARYQS